MLRAVWASWYINRGRDLDHPPADSLPQRAPARPQPGPRWSCRLCRTRGGGRTSWHCRTCDAVLYGPPLNTHRTALEGPAAVRISNARALADELDAAHGGLHR